MTDQHARRLLADAMEEGLLTTSQVGAALRSPKVVARVKEIGAVGALTGADEEDIAVEVARVVKDQSKGALDSAAASLIARGGNLPSAASKANLSASELLEFMATMSAIGNVGSLENPRTWAKVRYAGKDRVIKDALIDNFGVPSSMVQSLTAAEVMEGIGTSQTMGAEPDSQAFWSYYTSFKAGDIGSSEMLNAATTGVFNSDADSNDAGTGTADNTPTDTSDSDAPNTPPAPGAANNDSETSEPGSESVYTVISSEENEYGQVTYTWTLSNSGSDDGVYQTVYIDDEGNYIVIDMATGKQVGEGKTNGVPEIPNQSSTSATQGNGEDNAAVFSEEEEADEEDEDNDNDDDDEDDDRPQDGTPNDNDRDSGDDDNNGTRPHPDSDDEVVPLALGIAWLTNPMSGRERRLAEDAIDAVRGGGLLPPTDRGIDVSAVLEFYEALMAMLLRQELRQTEEAVDRGTGGYFGAPSRTIRKPILPLGPAAVRALMLRRFGGVPPTPINDQ